MSSPIMNDDTPIIDTALGTLLAEGLTPQAPPPERLGKLRGRLLRRAATMPQDHVDMTTVRADEGRWLNIAPGVELKPLHEDGASHAFLVRLQPGAVLPSHPHAADEECLVLEGEMHLGEFRFKAGDYHVARAGTSHGTVTSPVGGMMYVRSSGPPAYRT